MDISIGEILELMDHIDEYVDAKVNDSKVAAVQAEQKTQSARMQLTELERKFDNLATRYNKLLADQGAEK